LDNMQAQLESDIKSNLSFFNCLELTITTGTISALRN
jgi:hypothetical protein